MDGKSFFLYWLGGREEGFPQAFLGFGGSVEGSGILNPNSSSPTHSNPPVGCGRITAESCRVVIYVPLRRVI